MSRILPSGIRFKTGYLPVPEQSGAGSGIEYRHYAEIGDSPEVSMEEAVDLVRQAFGDPVLFADPRFTDFGKYVKSFYPQTVYDEDGFSTSTRFVPAIEKFPIDVDGLEEDPGPSHEVLGHPLSLYDVISFTHYLLTNTPSEGPNDPRLILLEELRGDREPMR